MSIRSWFIAVAFSLLGGKNRSNDSASAPLAHIKDGPLGQKTDIYCGTDIVNVTKQPFQRWDTVELNHLKCEH